MLAPKSYYNESEYNLLALFSKPDGRGATGYDNMGSYTVSSSFLHLRSVPLDAIYSLKEAFAADSNRNKVILGSGVYRDDDLKPWVLPSVQKVCVLTSHEDTIVSIVSLRTRLICYRNYRPRKRLRETRTLVGTSICLFQATRHSTLRHETSFSETWAIKRAKLFPFIPLQGQARTVWGPGF